MRQTILILILSTLTQGASADAGLIGTWKPLKGTCSSGAPYNDRAPGLNGVNPSESSIEITEDRMRTKLSGTVKHGADESAQLRGEIESAIANLDQASTGSKRAELESKLEWADKFRAGVTCESTVAFSYVIEGSTFRPTQVVEQTYSCPNPYVDGDDEGTIEGLPFRFKINGDVLEITPLEPTTAADDACPLGDYAIAHLIRVK